MIRLVHGKECPVAHRAGARRATGHSQPRLLDDQKWLMADLMHQAGLRLTEGLRVHHVDFGVNQVTVRDSRGPRSPLDG